MTGARNYFLNLSPGKLMGLRQITTREGKFKVLALDQNSVFNQAFGKDRDRTREAKLALTRTLGPHATSVLLDVPTSARQAINSAALPPGVGLIVRLEKGCSAGDYGYEETGWSVAKIKRMGASAVKLLVYMDVEDEKYNRAQLEFVMRAYEASCRHDILLMTEELSFPRKDAVEKGSKDSPDYARRRTSNILESTRLLGPVTDILKLEFPGEQHLKDLNEAAIRPWVLLSAGVDFDVFERQVAASMSAGAGGIMAGRAIFKEWLDPESPHFQNQEFLKGEAVRRIRRLGELVDEKATSWTDRYDLSDDDLEGAVEASWYSPRGTWQGSGY